MVMEQGNRGQTISLRLTDQEQEILAKRMKQAGISKKSAYLRKMAMNGYILKLDIPEIREMISLMRYSSNNLNQIAKRVNETGRIYRNDLQEIQDSQNRIWDGINKILRKLQSVQ